MIKKIKKLSIIIVTFESSQIIKSCLERLNCNKYDVFVVDNNSKDNTTKIVEEHFLEVKLIKLDNNIGYGRANNVALRKIKTNYALILNPDAFILEEDIDKIIEAMDKNNNFALGAPILLENYPPRKENIKKQKQIIEDNLINKINGDYSVKYIIGAVAFLKMSIFKKIGFYDENIFMYYEDDEISHRVVSNNYKCIIFNNIYGFHIGSGSSTKTFHNIFKRNLHKYLSKFYWKQKQKGKIIAVKSAIRLLLLNCFMAMINIINYKKLAANLGYVIGSFYFIIGLKAFNKKGRARG